jgi:MoaA/NifB/PqqE/SkfB family radical SAM enzyme
MSGNVKVDKLIKNASTQVLDGIVRLKPARNYLIKKGEQVLHHKFVEINQDKAPRKVQKMRCRAMENLLYTVNRSIEENHLSPHVRRRVLETFISNVLTGEHDRMRPFREKYGHNPPSFVVVSPTKKCNLRCTGCYAASSEDISNTMDYDVLSRMLWDKHREWGSNFTVISGGEPLMYKDGDRDIFTLFNEHPHNYFLMYTNGTLINEENARRLAEAGNVTPAISVEGWEKETDERRGKGIFKQVIKAMANLRKYGVPFGISITATRYNAETVMSDEFMNYFFDQQGAIYGWIFQYMPIGRSYSVDLMVTPEQRERMLDRELDLIYNQDRFIIDFWNGGPLSLGCISSGKPGGYFYIDWDGNIAPCVFVPYAVDNLYDIYRRGDTVSAPLQSAFFQNIRRFQNNYLGWRTEKPTKNLFMPCPIRDHHSFIRKLLEKYEVTPLDEEAEAAIHDDEYHRRMEDYDRRLHQRLDPKWQEWVNT